MRQLSPEEVVALARNVRRHRRALGLRPDELAEYLGVSAVYLTALEMGAIGRPFPEPLTRLARLVDLADWSDLLLAPSGDGGLTSSAVRPGRGRRPLETPTANAVERFIRQHRKSLDRI